MKNLLLSLSILAFLSTTAIASSIEMTDPLACEHCTKGHECDDKCKKGETSECCAEAKAKQNKTAPAEKKACCAKGKKSCHGEKAEKKEEGEKKEGKS